MNCPSELTLRQFLEGELSEEDSDRIVLHADACITCETVLQRLERQPDAVMDRPWPTEIADCDTVDEIQHIRKKLLAVPRAPEGSRPGSSNARFSARLNCPYCLNPIEVVAESKTDDVVCPACGSSLTLESNRTLTWNKERLPEIAHFELIEAVGRGAFGTVYKARDQQLQRVVAIKVPRSGVLATDEDEDRFVREARHVAQLRHPGIVAIYSVGRSETFPYLVSEFVEGVTLSSYLSSKRFNARDSAKLISDVARALHHAHKFGVVHRDLKPSNIMLALDNTPRIMDFGCAKRDVGEITVTIDGQILGTPSYMSPEQARGRSHQADARSDIYSVGVILFQLLTGELPFRGDVQMLLQQVIQDEPPSPRRLNHLVPRDLETICLKCLAKEPQRRYATALEFADDITRYLDGKPIQARPVGPAERAWRWCRRNPLVSSLSAVTGLLTACLAIGGTSSAIVISRQKAELATRNSELEAQTRIVEEQRDKIIEDQKELERHRELVLQAELEKQKELVKERNEALLQSRRAESNAAEAARQKSIAAVREIEANNQREIAEQNANRAARKAEEANDQKRVADANAVRATANFETALGIIERMLVPVASDDLKTVPEMEAIRQQLANDALQSIVKLQETDIGDSSRAKACRAKLVAIRGDLFRLKGPQFYPEALLDFRRAAKQLEEIVSQVGTDDGVKASYHAQILGLKRLIAEMTDSKERSLGLLRDVAETADRLLDSYPGQTDLEMVAISVFSSLGNAELDRSLPTAIKRLELAHTLVEKQIRSSSTVGIFTGAITKSDLYRYKAINLTSRASVLSNEAVQQQHSEEDIEGLFREALAIQTKLLADAPKSSALRCDRAWTLLGLTREFERRGTVENLQKASQIAGDALQVSEELTSEFPETMKYKYYLLLAKLAKHSSDWRLHIEKLPKNSIPNDSVSISLARRISSEADKADSILKARLRDDADLQRVVYSWHLFASDVCRENSPAEADRHTKLARELGAVSIPNYMPKQFGRIPFSGR